MTSSRPYLIRALWEWISDNGITPYLMVSVDHPEVNVPMDYVQDGKIILNVGPAAVHNLNMGNDMIQFSARFGGRPMLVEVPVAAVLAIYARETGQGMLFGSEPGAATEGTLLDQDPAAKTKGGQSSPENDDPPPSKPGPGRRRKASHLRVVK